MLATVTKQKRRDHMYYAYKSHQLASSILVTVVSDLGYIHNIYEFYSMPAAKKLLIKWFGSDLEWCDKPWDDINIKRTKEAYEITWGVPFEGRVNERGA